MKHFFLFLLLLIAFFPKEGQAQWMLINEGGGDPDASAALEISSDARGILIPRMKSASRMAISSPAEGLMVYQVDGTKGFYFYNGSAWDTLATSAIINNNITNITNITAVNQSNIAVIRDVKASGNDGGDFTAGSWIARDLNDLRGDSSFIKIDGDSIFTLDSGIYEITATAPARRVDEHQIRLYNKTTSTIAAVGTAMQAASASPPSTLITVVNVTLAQEEFVIQHRCETTRNTDGFGSGVSWGSNVFTQVRIQKL